jgi:hypothetical protein
MAYHLEEFKDMMAYNHHYAKDNYKPEDFINRLAEVLKK